MRFAPLLNLTLALVTALWSPAWCCCAQASVEAAQAAALPGEDHCSHCVDFDDSAPLSPGIPHQPAKCPHASQHTWATTGKVASVELPVMLALDLPAMTVALPPVATSGSLTVAAQTASPLSPATLLNLGCLHLI